MSQIDYSFREMCESVFSYGQIYENKKRGVKRLQIPSYSFRHEFKDGFPALSLKKLEWEMVVGELLWFLRGDNDIEYLNNNGIKIWNKDAYNWYCKNTVNPMSFKEFSAMGRGSVGRNYSVQWRDFNGTTDQIKNLIEEMKTDIMSSRLKVNAWNPSELDQTALPPCHSEFQVIGVPLEDGKFGFELHWNQRSTDVFLGAPFNIASYGLLAKDLELITGYEALAIEASFKCVHFYDNQLKAAWELINRDCDKNPNCGIEISAIYNQNLTLDQNLNNWSISDFKLKGYQSFEALKVPMLAPKGI
jgi:thymidylate synthase